MKISNSRWIFIFIYLVITFPIGIFIAATTTQVLIRLFYFLYQGVSVDLTTVNYIKILKGSLAGGIIGAIGCWWIYYQHYRKNRSS